METIWSTRPNTSLAKCLSNKKKKDKKNVNKG